MRFTTDSYGLLQSGAGEGGGLIAPQPKTWHNPITHLLLDVLKRRRGDDAKAHQEHIRLGVRQWPKAVVVLLTSRVEETQRVGLATNHDRDSVVVKDLRVEREMGEKRKKIKKETRSPCEQQQNEATQKKP